MKLGKLREFLRNENVGGKVIREEINEVLHIC
jgi:hypothetical protein